MLTSHQDDPQRAARGPRRRRRGRVALASCGMLALLALIFAGCSLTGSTAGPNTTNFSAGTPAPTVAVPPSAQDLQQTVINVVHTVQPSVVEVLSQGGSSEAIGSGEIISQDGYIVTNDHVVDGFSTFSVNLSNGQTLAAQLVGKAPNDDLAVLKVGASGPLTPITFGSSKNVQVGQFAIAIGSPLGLEQSATFGIVSAVNRTASEGQEGPATQPLSGLIQTSAPINPGNSGGALVDLQGRLIGVPTLAAADPNSGAAANGIGFAIPSDRVQYVQQQLVKNGRLTDTGQGFLGIRGQDVTPQLASAYNLPVQNGVLVSAFANDTTGKSPAQQAGMKTGDIITAVNNTNIPDSSALSSALVSLSPGTKVTVTVYRGANKQNLTVTLGDKPAQG